MNFLDEMKSKYGELNSKYSSSIKNLKERIEEHYRAGKTCCVWHDSPERMERLEKELSEFKFKPSKSVSKIEGYISRLVCWD